MAENEQQTPEELAEEEAAFSATFEEPTDQAPAEGSEGAEVKPEAGQGTQQEAAAEPAAAEAESAKEPTIADLLAIIEAGKSEQAKLRDKVFGKVGELQQKIDSMKTQSSGISPAARERLKADFPELAEMLFEGAEPVAEQQQVVAPVQTAAPTAEDGDRKIEVRLLTRDHRDWQQVVNSPEFAAWKTGVLKPEDSAILDTSWDADYISGKITDFKTWKAAEQKKAAEADAKKQRLSSAITPKGVPRTNTSTSGDDDEEAAMLESYGKRGMK